MEQILQLFLHSYFLEVRLQNAILYANEPRKLSWKDYTKSLTLWSLEGVAIRQMSND